jgi:1,4-dihydroxy-2-naphthoate octaprenyltransferase
MKNSTLDLVVAGTREGILMVESEASELSEEKMLEAVMFGCSVTGLLGLCVGAFQGGNSAISNVGGVCSVIVIFYEGGWAT